MTDDAKKPAGGVQKYVVINGRACALYIGEKPRPGSLEFVSHADYAAKSAECEELHEEIHSLGASLRAIECERCGCRQHAGDVADRIPCDGCETKTERDTLRAECEEAADLRRLHAGVKGE